MWEAILGLRLEIFQRCRFSWSLAVVAALLATVVVAVVAALCM
jgi:hypothetical protein